jgi:hypothetical protein
MRWLDLGSAVFGIAAAILWFTSASEPPPINTYWNGPPPDDPFVVALTKAGMMNRWAALATGLSVSFIAVKGVIEWWLG